MPDWNIVRTDTFLKYLKRQRNNHKLLIELDNKIKRLRDDPNSVGGNLAGNLHGNMSTRLGKNFRMIFKIDNKNNTVYLLAIDHRKDVY